MNLSYTNFIVFFPFFQLIICPSNRVFKPQEELLDFKEEQEEQIQNQVTKEVTNAENGIAEINKIRMFQKDGTEITQISQGEDVILEISYTVYEEQIEEPVLGIAIRSIDHTYIC